MKTVAIFITNDETFDRRILRIKSALETSYKVTIIGVQRHAQGKGMSLLIKKGWLFYLEYNIRAFIHLIRHKYDIVIAVDYDTLLGVQPATRLRHMKFVFDAHEYYEESIEIQDRPWVKRIWSRIGRIFLKNTDLAYSVSHSIAKIYTAKYGYHYHTIRNIPNYKFQSEPCNEDPKIILYQGVLNRGRKLELLIDSASYLSSDFEIWIIGEGDLSEELKKTNASNVKFFSWVHPDDLANYTSQAFLGYNLLDSSSQSYYYSLANKFFDYLQSGVPSLNSPFPEYAEMNESYYCCYTIDVDSAKELADMIMTIAAHSSDYKEKVKNAQLAALDLNWENESQKLMRLFHEL